MRLHAWFVCKEITKQKCPGVSQHSHISHIANPPSTILGHWRTLRNKGRKLPQLRKSSNLFADCNKNAFAVAIFHLDLYRLAIRYENLVYFYDRNYLHAKDRLVSWTSMEFPGKHRAWMKKSGDHFVTRPKRPLLSCDTFHMTLTNSLNYNESNSCVKWTIKEQLVSCFHTKWWG